MLVAVARSVVVGATARQAARQRRRRAEGARHLVFVGRGGLRFSIFNTHNRTIGLDPVGLDPVCLRSVSSVSISLSRALSQSLSSPPPGRDAMPCVREKLNTQKIDNGSWRQQRRRGAEAARARGRKCFRKGMIQFPREQKHNVYFGSCPVKAGRSCFGLWVS